MPRIANSSGRWPASLRLKIAGSSLLRVRSPDAPKMTKTQESARFDMAAELGTQRGEQLFRERVVAPRSEPRVQRRRQYVGRHFFLDGRMDSPPAFTGVGNIADKLRELRIGGERQRREVEQPRADDAAAPPEFGNRGEIQIVSMFFRQRAGRRITEDVESLRIGLHQPVLDAVVDHLDEVARTGRSTVEKPFVRRCLRCIEAARRSSLPLTGR